MVHFEGVNPTPMFGELPQNREPILSDRNARYQDWLVSGQIVVARAQSHWNLKLHQHLHPFIRVDQLWNDTIRVKHVQQIASDADHIVAIGDRQNPFKPWFVEMKVCREEEFHDAAWSRRNAGTGKKQRKEAKEGLKRN